MIDGTDGEMCSFRRFSASYIPSAARDTKLSKVTLQAATYGAIVDWAVREASGGVPKIACVNLSAIFSMKSPRMTYSAVSPHQPSQFLRAIHLTASAV